LLCVRYKDKNWLQDQYHNKGKTQKEIANSLGVARSTITRWIKRHDIEARSTGVSQAEGEYKDKEWLREHYHGKQRSMADIGGEFGVSKETIKYWIEKHGIEKRDHSAAAELRAEQHPHTIPDNEKLHPTFYRRRGYSIVSCGVDDKHVELHGCLPRS